MRPEKLWWMSVQLHRGNHRILAKLVKLINYWLFSAVLPYECDIDPTVSILHRGLCVVVHPNTTIGSHVSIGHGVTLAAGSNEPGSPYRIIVEDDVIIGSHSMVICRTHEELRLGRGCVVGGGSIVTRSVGPGEIVAGPPARVIGIRSTN
ncbi:MAG: acyltransferase [Pseudonocardiaceae bacterium]